MMNKPNRTPQELFWAGDFGVNYIDRNSSESLLSSKIHFWSKVLPLIPDVKSILEYGSSIGLNLKALQLLDHTLQLNAVEINATACVDYLSKFLPDHAIANCSILEHSPDACADLVFTSGVLIHQEPATLPAIYKKLYDASSRYILVSEYYSPHPQSLIYRGQEDRLFKRDYAGELLAAYPDLTLLQYGFTYHGDSRFPLDDLTWFLLRKS